MSKGFEIRPLRQYDAPRYPSTHLPPVDDLDELRRKPGPVKLLLMGLMILGMSMGLMACFGDFKGKLNDRWDVITSADAGGGGGGDGGHDDDGGDIVMGEMVECTPGDIVCEGDSLASCNDDYFYSRESCDEICQARYPEDPSYAYSLGCDASAADPCQCQYDMVDGGMPACMPGDVYCADDTTLVTCDDNYGMETVDCEAYCDDFYGDTNAYSLGCDASVEDACQCQYDMVAGVMAECTPGDVECIDDSTLSVCTDDWFYEHQDCNSRCAAEGKISLGCNTAAADPCQCEYDIVDGDVAACTPGDVVCLDENTAGVCTDSWDQVSVSCAEHCTVTYGEGYTSIGCDVQDLENYCGCKNDS